VSLLVVSAVSSDTFCSFVAICDLLLVILGMKKAAVIGCFMNYLLPDKLEFVF